VLAGIPGRAGELRQCSGTTLKLLSLVVRRFVQRREWRTAELSAPPDHVRPEDGNDCDRNPPPVVPPHADLPHPKQDKYNRDEYEPDQKLAQAW